ncbi:MAG: hypothetical protein CMJ83_15435 [Planctomycetes bacterium]|nr:hypothetical protein [Planctomycetota bacterium]
MSLVIIVRIVLLASVLVIPLSAQLPVVREQTAVAPASAAAFDQAGSNVAVDGDVLIIGAPHPEDPSSPTATPGTALVFRRTAGMWTEEASLAPNDGMPGDRFGARVAVDGDRAAVGAQQHGVAGVPAAGAVYVYCRTGGTWDLEAKLVAVDPSPWALFGSVAIDGDTIAVGAIGADAAGVDTGAVYVFSRNSAGWAQQAKLLAGDGAAGDRFGGTIALQGDRLVVGAPRHDDGAGTWTGAAYVFERNGGAWTQTTELVASDATPDDRFGHGVALDGATVAIGAPYRDGNGADAGAVYVFGLAATGWVQEQVLVPAAGGTCQGFGKKIGLQGDWLVTGAPGLGTCVPSAVPPGTASLYQHVAGTWTERATLAAGGAAPGDRFGFSIALDAGTVVVGAPRDDDFGTDAGTAFVFAATDCLLGTDVTSVSLAAGGSQILHVAAPAAAAGNVYHLLGTTGGTWPGIHLPLVILPLNVDAAFGWFFYTALLPNTQLLQASRGYLDAAGAATVTLDLPAGLPPALAGLVAHHACLVTDAQTGIPVHASHPAAVTLVP